MPVTDHASAFSVLPAQQQAILFILLVADSARSKAQLLANLHALGVRSSTAQPLDHASLAGLLDSLLEDDWLTVGNQHGYRLKSRHKNTVLAGLWQTGVLQGWQEKQRAWLRRLDPAWDGAGPASTTLEMLLALLAGDADQLMQHMQYWENAPGNNQRPPGGLLEQLLADSPGQQLFERLDPALQKTLLTTTLQRESWAMGEVNHAWRYACQQQARLTPVTPALQEAQTLLTIWRGELPCLADFATDALSLSATILSGLLRGQHQQTANAAWAYLTSQDTLGKSRGNALPKGQGLLLALALLAGGDVLGNSGLIELARMGNQQSFTGAWSLLPGFQRPAQEKGRLPIPLPSALMGLDGLVHALLRFWLGDQEAQTAKWKQTLQLFARQLQHDGYVLAAQEMEALLLAQFGEARSMPDWHQQHRLVPLVQLYQKQEAWQQALSALRQLNKRDTASTTRPTGQQRLAWWISIEPHGIRLEPREQRLSANGQWSKGRVVALWRLREAREAFDYLVEQDAQVITCIRQQHAYYYGGSEYELEGEAALPALVGHPAVFWAEAPAARVEVVSGQVSLQLSEQTDKICLRLMPGNVSANSSMVYERETPTRLKVYLVSEDVRQIAAIVGKTLSVPLQGKQQLVSAITSIAPLLPIHSDLSELAEHIDSIPADGKLYAHLLPLEAGLRLQLLVRPLASGGWYPPGHGMGSLLGEQDDKPLQIIRDLAAEHAALYNVLATCPLLQEVETDGREWLISEPQMALTLLSQLQTLDSNLLQCIWPEGERMRIRSRGETSQMRFSLQSHGGWFELSGNLTLDDGKVVQLRQLLSLLQESRGRFVSLGDGDWLALSETLRKQLEQLSLLASHVRKNSLRLHALTAPFLTELQSTAGGFHADATWQTQRDTLSSLGDWQPAVPSTLQAELRDYQLDGYHWLARLARWGVGACLADDMGLGKTVQTLTLLLARAADGPQLVVAPTSVSLNWLSETSRFAPTLRLRFYQQQRALDDLQPFDLVVVSYGLLQQDAEQFSQPHWHSVVLDEAQAIKNAQTKRSQAATGLNADFRLAISGTPLENHLGELWSLFNFINPGLLGSQEDFGKRFALPIENGNAAAHMALKALIQPFMLRRRKRQVLDALPARTEISYSVALSPEEMHVYEALRQQAVEKIDQLASEEAKPLQVLAEITRLRRFCCHPRLVQPDSALPGSKLAACAAIIHELLENQHKALVFSQFVDHLAIVRAYLDQQGIAYQYLDGATRPKERQARVNAFQQGEGDIFLISLKAGGTGLNLTAADYVIHLDPWWNPAVEDQASDRAHRLGQLRPVTIYRLIAEHTIEEKIVSLHAKKRDLADNLLNGGELSAKLDADALLALLRGR